MELIKITDQKLKIMLTPSDMTHFALDSQAIEACNLHTPEVLRGLLTEIRQRYGLDFDDSHLSVQYFPSREGGCEMFVCGIRPQEDKERKKQNASVGNAILPIKKQYSSGFFRETAYRFSRLDDLLAACHRLRGIGYIGESDAYRDSRTAYYLLLKMASVSPFTLPEELNFLCEYGSPENASALRLYFREHGTLIRPHDAVEVLAHLH